MDILITEEIEATSLPALAERCSVVCETQSWKDPVQFKLLLRDARTVLVRNQTQLTRAIIEGAPQLLAIGRFGVGLDNIDLAAASEFGVVVISPVQANSISVAELTVGLMLALARKIPQADRSTKAGRWDRKGHNGSELNGKSVALCGFGRIGRLVQARLAAFGMHTLVYDPFIKPADTPASHFITHCSDLRQALEAADFVSVHLPLTTETKHLFNTRVFASIKAGAFFINTSRGSVVDETALLAALRNGRLAGAALDVREVEPPVQRAGFEEMDNVILTPHIAAFTTESQNRTFEAVASDLTRILEGQPAENFVNFPVPRHQTKN